MSDDIIAIINDLQSDDTYKSENARRNLIPVLKSEIDNALIKQQTCQLYDNKASIYTIYEDTTPSNSIPPKKETILPKKYVPGYRKRETQNDNWRWIGVRIKAFNFEVDFFDAYLNLLELFKNAILDYLFYKETLSDKDREKAKTLFDGLNGEKPEERKKWIRNNLKLVLNNNIYKDFTNRFKKIKRAAYRNLLDKTKELKCLTDFVALLENFFSNEESTKIDKISFLVCAIYIYEEAKISRSEFSNHRKWIAENLNTDWFKNRLEELPGNFPEIDGEKLKKIITDIQTIKNKIIENYNIEQKDLNIQQNIESTFSSENNDAWFNEIEELMDIQRHHYFWKKTDPPVWEQTLKQIYRFTKHILADDKIEVTFIQNNQTEKLVIPKNPIENKEFCTWLMDCSGFSRKELACLWEKSEPTISRWLTHPKLLKLPFIDMDFPPVYFDSDIREQIDKNSKNSLWSIYEFLMNKNAPYVIDQIAQGAATEFRLQFDFKLIDRNDIDEISVYTNVEILCQIVSITRIES
jgi:hypothetical protein